MKQYEKYLDLQNNIKEKIDISENSIKSIPFDQIYLKALISVDDYATSIGATRKGNIYTLSHGQCIRYSKFIKQIKTNCFIRKEIENDYSLFYKTSDELKQFESDYTFNKLMKKNINNLKNGLNVINNEILNIKNCISSNTKSELISKLFDSEEEYIYLHINKKPFSLNFNTIRDYCDLNDNFIIEGTTCFIINSHGHKIKTNKDELALFLFTRNSNKKLLKILFIYYSTFICHHIVEDLF